MSLDFDTARMPNPNVTPEHEEWRAQLRKFIDVEIMPHAQDWDEAGHIPIGISLADPPHDLALRVVTHNNPLAGVGSKNSICRRRQ